MLNHVRWPDTRDSIVPGTRQVAPIVYRTRGEGNLTMSFQTVIVSGRPSGIGLYLAKAYVR